VRRLLSSGEGAGTAAVDEGVQGAASAEPDETSTDHVGSHRLQGVAKASCQPLYLEYMAP